MSLDPTGQDSLRMARYLSGISLFTRGIGILGVIGSLIGLVAALNQRSSDDRLGFSLISLGVLLIAVVVWSTGTFHGAMARVVPLVVRIDERLEEAEVQRRMLAVRALAPVPAETPAGAPAVAPAPAAEVPAEPIRLKPPPEPKPEPVKIPCPSCGGLIHPEATRCVHCMKRVAHA
ncbi:MAG: hypothetical protein IPM35_38170 [Myxococcales bacterium]|nr:hypothetical protein [Myxococcales bacterium]